MSKNSKAMGQIDELLKMLVGVKKGAEPTGFAKMTEGQFTLHVQSEIAKAFAEPEVQKMERLASLSKSVDAVIALTKDNYTDSTAEGFNVPITWADTTAMDEKQNQLIDALTNMRAASESGKSAFTQGFMAKFAEFVKAVEGEGAAEPEKQTVGETAASQAGSEKAATVKVGEDIEEDDAAVKAAASAVTDPPPSPDAAGDGAATRKGIVKGDDVSPDGTRWPEDLNTAAFMKEEAVVVKSLDWGRDGEK